MKKAAYQEVRQKVSVDFNKVTKIWKIQNEKTTQAKAKVILAEYGWTVKDFVAETKKVNHEKALAKAENDAQSGRGMAGVAMKNSARIEDAAEYYGLTIEEMQELLNKISTQTELAVEGYVYCNDYCDALRDDAEELFSEIESFFPCTTWLNEDEIPELEYNEYYNVLIKFDGTITKGELEIFKNLFKDFLPGRYSINYEEIDDSDEPEETIETEISAQTELAEDDGSNDEPDDDFLADYDAEISEDDDEDDELIDEPEVQEIIYTAIINIYENGKLKQRSQEFKSVYDACAYLKKSKLSEEYKYSKGIEEYHSITSWDGKTTEEIEEPDDTSYIENTAEEIENKEITSFKIGEFFSTEILEPDTPSLESFEIVQLLSIYDGCATFLTSIEEIIKGDVAVENDVEIVKINIPYLGTLAISAANIATGYFKGTCKEIFTRTREWHKANAEVDLEKREPDNEDADNDENDVTSKATINFENEVDPNQSENLSNQAYEKAKTFLKPRDYDANKNPSKWRNFDFEALFGSANDFETYGDNCYGY